MEVILVQENFIDGVKVSHCGVVICKKTIDVNDKETWSFNLPDLDGTTSMIKFHTEDVKKIFLYPEKAMIGFLFSSHMERKSLIMEVKMDNGVTSPYDEFNNFKKMSSQMFSNKAGFVTTLHNQREAKKYVTSNLQRGCEVWKMVFSLGKNRGLATTEDDYGGSYKAYFRCYTNFLQMNPSAKGRDLKRIIREVDDLPKFMKEIYSGSNVDILQHLLYGFLVLHRCSNPGCKKFSYLKCQECRYVRYCGKDCQILYWSYHRDECQEARDRLDRMFLIPELIRSQTESIHGNELLTFEVFFKELSYKLFEVLYDSMKTPELSFLFGENSVFASYDVSRLVKRRGVKSQTWESFQKQFFNAFGKKWDSKPLKVAVFPWS